MEPRYKSRLPLGLFLFGAGVGIATAFLFDPSSGKRRRARIRDKTARVARHALTYAGRRSLTLRQRLKGTVCELRRELRAEVEVDDLTLVQRVRSQLGHAISQARQLTIEANRGVVTLTGPINYAEVESLITCVEKIPGVKAVNDQLDIHEKPERARGVPADWHKLTPHGIRH